MRRFNAFGACCVLGLGAGIGVSAGAGAWMSSPARGGEASAADTAPKFATVNILRIVRGMMTTAEVVAQRSALENQYVGRLQQIMADAQAMQTQAQGLAPGDPQIEVLNNRLQEMAQQYQQVQQEAQGAVDQLSATQARNAYAIIHGKVNEVAAELGYSHVIASELTPEGATFSSTNIAMQEILGRPLVRAPFEDDLTERVMAALNVKDPVPPTTEPPAGPQDQPGEAPGTPPETPEAPPANDGGGR